MADVDMVSSREFLEHARATDGEIAQIRERQSKLEASLTHVPADLAAMRVDLSAQMQKLTNEVSAMRLPPATPASSSDQVLLAMHRALDAKKTDPIALFGYIIGAGAIAWIIRGVIPGV